MDIELVGIDVNKLEGSGTAVFEKRTIILKHKIVSGCQIIICLLFHNVYLIFAGNLLAPKIKLNDISIKDYSRTLHHCYKKLVKLKTR